MRFAYNRRYYAAPLSGAPALEVRDLTVVYPGATHPVLHAISLIAQTGTRVALVGPNGSGKSTLLKAVAGLLRPQQGTISIYGLPVGGCHHRVAYLPQRSEIDWRFPVNVRRLVLAGRYVHLGWLRRPGKADWQRVDAALEQLGLEALGERQIGALSGGQQQRALLARALVQEADLLLLDEPLTGVDAETRATIASVLDDLKQQGKTSLIATHHLDRLADEYDDIIALEDGRRRAFTNDHVLVHTDG